MCPLGYQYTIIRVCFLDRTSADVGVYRATDIDRRVAFKRKLLSNCEHVMFSTWLHRSLEQVRINRTLLKLRVIAMINRDTRVVTYDYNCIRVLFVLAFQYNTTETIRWKQNNRGTLMTLIKQLRFDTRESLRIEDSRDKTGADNECMRIIHLT